MQKVKPFLIFFLYVFIRKCISARREGRPIEAKGYLIPVFALLLINLDAVVVLPKLLSFLLVLPILVVSSFYCRDLYLVKKGRLSPDNKVGTKSSDKLLLELFVVLILSVLISRLFGFSYFNNFLGIQF